jgi:chitinase
MKDCVRKWDARARVPYLVCPAWRTLVSYDDIESIHYKIEYAKTHDVRGVIIWEITADYLADGSSPLLNAVFDGFHESRSPRN